MYVENISPSEVIPGEQFSIEFDLVNDEPEDRRIRIYIKENDKIIPDSQLAILVKSNETYHFRYSHPGIYRTSFFTIVIEIPPSRLLLIPVVFPAMVAGMLISDWGWSKWVAK